MKFYTLLGLLAELDNFSLEELLEVQQKVNKLIQSRTLNQTAFGNTNPPEETGYYTVAKRRVHNNLQVLLKGSYYRATLGASTFGG